MSRIGKLPITIPQGVNVSLEGHAVKLTGPKGTLESYLPASLKAEIKDNQIFIFSDENKEIKPLYGTFRALLANNVKGVSEGWSKQLELVGTGYRAEVKDKNLVLTIGFSHPVVIKAPEGINFKVEKNIITIDGIDKDLVGQITAEIRRVKPPEPYKGKGILYLGEIIRRKAGKAAKTQGQTV